MLKRMEIPVTVYHLLQSVDKYGQPRLEWDNKIDTKAIYYITNKSTVSNPDYEDIDAIALMREKNFDSEYLISINGKNYRIQYSYPKAFGHRYTQYFLRDTNEEPTEQADFFYKLDTDVTTTEEEGALHLHLSAVKSAGYSPVIIEGEEYVAPWIENNTNLYEVTFETALQPTSIYRWFDASNISTIHNLNRLDLTKCTSMQWAFRDCHNLTGDIKFSTGAPLNKSLRSTFKNCWAVNSIDVTGLCTSNCTSLNSLFHSCYQLKKITGLNTFDTSNVTEFTCLFNFCYALTRVDGIEGWDTKNVEKMNGVFYGCNKLPFIHIPNWDFSKVDTVANMFRDCENIGSIDITNFTPYALTTMSRMFANDACLVTIKCNIVALVPPEGCTISKVFENCYSLPNWSASADTAGAWIIYVRKNVSTCPAITYQGITEQRLVFRFEAQDTGYTYTRIPNYAQPFEQQVYWAYTTGNIPVAWSFYTNIDNIDRPFRVVLRKQNYLCSYCDVEYHIDGDVQTECYFSYSISSTPTQGYYAVTFTSSEPLGKDEWYAYTVYQNEAQYPVGQVTSYITTDEFSCNLPSGTYVVWFRRCKHHYNPSIGWAEFTIE